MPGILEIMVGTVDLTRLRFTVELATLLLPCGIVDSGRLHHRSCTRDCAVSAQLKYRDTGLHKPMESRKVTLPGRLGFRAPGLAIG